MRMRRLQANWVTIVFGVLALLGTGISISDAFLSDTANHPPPTTGQYGYNTFVPGSAGFPGLGGTYVDPVFGSTIKRLTTFGPSGSNFNDIYAHHWCNANGTYCFSDPNGALSIINASTGAVLWSGQPGGSNVFDIEWHPTNPDKYFFLTSGSGITERTLSTQTNVTFATGIGCCGSNGGSVDWVDGTGTYFVVVIGSNAQVFERTGSTTGTLYTGTARNGASGGSYNWMSPDGNYIVSGAGGQTPQISYAVNKVAKSIGAGVSFWTLAGDHAYGVTASDGKTYWVTLDGVGDAPGCPAGNTMGLFARDVTLVAGTESQQIAGSRLLACLSFNHDLHLTGGFIGANKDWVMIDTEIQRDVVNYNPASGWGLYDQEIIALNVLTSEVRRLAHHRSRSIWADYYNQPHVSSSWDGSVVIWESNFNISGNYHVDLYAITNPLGSGTSPDLTPPAPPLNLRVQ